MTSIMHSIVKQKATRRKSDQSYLNQNLPPGTNNAEWKTLEKQAADS